MATKLKIEYVPIADLKPYEGNAKKHPIKQINQIISSIKEFGMNDPIAVWGEDNTIVEGHGRLLALQKMGWTEVPIIRLDDLTDEQRRAYTLVHNKLTMNTGFDVEKLNVELSTIDSLDMNKFDLKLQGVDFNDPIEHEDLSDKFNEKFAIEITCESEEQQQDLYAEFSERGFECRIV